MNLRPGNLSNFFVCHSLRAGFFELIPTIGFFTTASLKWSTTAAMAKTPPSRSYKLFSVMFTNLPKLLRSVSCYSLVTPDESFVRRAT
jgi:hypothetical protein